MSMSMKDHDLLVKIFYKNGNYVLAALKEFWSLNDMKTNGLMSTKILKKKD